MVEFWRSVIVMILYLWSLFRYLVARVFVHGGARRIVVRISMQSLLGFVSWGVLY